VSRARYSVDLNDARLLPGRETSDTGRDKPGSERQPRTVR
jgi:hypothetical protein